LNAVPNRSEDANAPRLPYTLNAMSPSTQKLVGLHLKRAKATHKNLRNSLNASIKRISANARNEQDLEELELTLDEYWDALDLFRAEVAYSNTPVNYNKVENKETQLQSKINELQEAIDRLRNKIANRHTEEKKKLNEIAERNRTTNYALDNNRKSRSRKSRKATRKSRK